MLKRLTHTQSPRSSTDDPLTPIISVFEQHPVLATLQTDRCRTSLLHMAAHWGHLPVVHTLVTQGADITKSLPTNHNDKKTPLDMARDQGHEDIVTYLTYLTDYMNNLPQGEIPTLSTIQALANSAMVLATKPDSLN